MLRNLTFRTAVATCVALSMAMSPVIMSAQQPPADVPTITIRANSRLVLVDVVVTDKKGGPITGLKAEDFTLEENGKKQKVSVFVPPGTASHTPAAEMPPGVYSNHPEHLSPGGPLTIILLDAANSPFADQAYGRLQMLKYVEEQGQSGRQMAVMTLTDHLNVLQQFTSDPQILRTSLKNYKPQSQPFAPAVAPPASTSSGADSPGPGMSIAIAAAAAAIGNFQGIQVSYQEERRTVVTIQAMQSLARMLAGLPGRKTVIWLSAGLPFDLIPADRNINEAELMDALPSVKQKSVGTVATGSAEAAQRERHGDDIRRAEAQLAAAGIAIYPIDLRGLMSGMEFLRDDSANRQAVDSSGQAISRMSDVTASQETLREIAAETGGKAYVNQNESKDGVAMAVADEAASYTLGYYPENKKWDGKYRNIKVKVGQGDTAVRHRKGYFAIDPTQEKGRKDEQDVADALQVNAPATQISFMAQAKPTDPGKVRVVFLVDAHTLSAEDSSGGKKMNVSLYATAYDANGKMLSNRSIKVDKAFDAGTYQQVLDKGMLVPVDLEIPAGSKELRLAVLDNKTGFIGTVSGPLGQ